MFLATLIKGSPIVGETKFKKPSVPPIGLIISYSVPSMLLAASPAVYAPLLHLLKDRPVLNAILNPYGNGIVMNITGGVVTIAFKNPKYGAKKLALSVAPLTKIID